MIENPKVSIIIPAYNSEKTLRQCLNSVLNQIYKNYEVIVVNNNSTDETKDIIKEFQKKNRKVKYFFESIRKMGAARNTGEKRAEGEIILMTDSDCIVPCNWITEMIKPIITGRYNGVQGSEINATDDFWNRQIQLGVLEKIKKTKNKNIIIGRIDPKNFAISREALKKIGFTSRKYFSAMDTELAIRFQKNNLKLKFLKNIKIKHHHADNIRTVIRKYCYRAYWCTIVTKDHKNFLKNTDFLKETAQTPFSFIKFFPGLIKTVIQKGFKYAYYDFITGVSWRIGLIYGWLGK